MTWTLRLTRWTTSHGRLAAPTREVQWERDGDVPGWGTWALVRGCRAGESSDLGVHLGREVGVGKDPESGNASENSTKALPSRQVPEGQRRGAEACGPGRRDSHLLWPPAHFPQTDLRSLRSPRPPHGRHHFTASVSLRRGGDGPAHSPRSPSTRPHRHWRGAARLRTCHRAAQARLLIVRKTEAQGPRK